MSTKPPTHAPSAPPPRRRKNRQTWIVAGALATFAAILLIAGSGIVSGPGPAPRARTEPPNPASSRPAVKESTASPTLPNNLIDDDGQTFWASPTDGKPLDLAYLPPGMELVVALRPREILDHPEGEKLVAALGPLGNRAVTYLEAILGAPLRDINNLNLAAGVAEDGTLFVSLVAAANEPVSLSLARLRKRLLDAAEHTHANEVYLVAGEHAYFLPPDRAGTLVVAPADLMPEIIDFAGDAPPLRRDLERLLARTDVERQVTILLAPNFLFGEGQGIFAGPMARLRAPLFWFLGDEFSAAGLSLHWDENFFAELIAVPTLDTLPERASQILAERVATIPESVEEYVFAMRPSEYSRRVVARFPEMMRRLAAYTRRASDRDIAILRCYLPAIAGHNLLMAAELTLAEPAGAVAAADGTSTPVAASAASSPGSVADRLAQKTSLRFARETLESALAQLADDINVEITILGPDLQLEGITKNQSFGLALTERPAEEILIEILRRANPDKTATGPSDPRQKLVYIVLPGNPESIIITTRARALQRAEKLPAVFTTP